MRVRCAGRKKAVQQPATGVWQAALDAKQFLSVLALNA